MAYLIDSQQLFDILLPAPDDSDIAHVVRELLPTAPMFISAISLGEIYAATHRIDMRSADNLRTNLVKFTARIGRSNILPFDDPVARKWGEYCHLVPTETPGVTSEALMIAATATYYSYTLITSEVPYLGLLPDLSVRLVKGFR